MQGGQEVVARALEYAKPKTPSQTGSTRTASVSASHGNKKGTGAPLRNNFLEMD